jgi:ParB family transcriptional regulator, chromosome partitioning protein
MTTPRTARPASGLGRGLAALIPQHAAATPAPVEIPLAAITVNPRQPRHNFDDDRLEALTLSIAEHGVIQPILVTETVDGYQLVAGERRVRAARRAGLERIPAVVRQLADREQLELAIVENIQRSDLDAVEEAKAYRQLMDEFGFTQEQVAQRVGRARSTIANTLRLLELTPTVLDAVSAGTISEGHARALIGLSAEHQAHVLTAIERDGLAVRHAEELVRRLRAQPGADTASGTATGGAPAAGAAAADGDAGGNEPSGTSGSTTEAAAIRPLDDQLEHLEGELRTALGTKVSLVRSRRGGRIVIEYYSDEELGRLYERLVGGDA